MTSKKLALDLFLNSHKYIKTKNEITHTRIPNAKLGIFGGSYSIPEECMEEFINLYYESVIEGKNSEYLTEKQLTKNGPLLVDIDMRYEATVKDKQYNSNHIIDIIQLYLDKLIEILKLNYNDEFNIYIFEKREVNPQENFTKDGIHILFGIGLDHNVQMVLRKNIIEEINSIWNDIPIINTWESVFDEGISAGYTNWQLYGSKKPEHDTYRLTSYYTCVYTNEFELTENKIYSIKDILPQLMARYNKFPTYELKIVIPELHTKKKKSLKIKTNNNIFTDISYLKNIKNQEELDDEVEEYLKNCSNLNQDINIASDTVRYYLKEIHEYTMLLPEDFYETGTYDKWIRVGWALRMTHYSLIITWIKFSSQSKEFNFNDIDNLISLWKNMDVSEASKKLSSRSIIYWAKEYGDPNSIRNIETDSINYFILETLKQSGGTDYDFANVLFNMYKGSYICVSIKHNIWYEYKKHRWHEIDSGTTLRSKISKNMFQNYLPILQKEVDKLSETEDPADYEKQEKRVQHILNLSARLKKTTDKDKIMREARELFYDNNFIEQQDSKPYLLGFTNGVFDFEEEHFRPGRPDDYIVKCTGYDYVPLHSIDPTTIAEVKQFMTELFPIDELRKYMWEHLASTLIGTNENQTFNIYTGTGRNGKSILVLLMSKVLGDYKATIPVTLITQKRTQIGSTSSEIVALKGVRYAVMQEPSKGDKINEGIMKELTGGDPLQGRALFQNSITFIPQFELVCCLNELFEINSNDDGTWRRIRVCDFMSKFTENPIENDPEQPYQFKVNKKLEEKFSKWKTAMMSELISIALKRKGNVEDCSIVLAKSQEYREGQDYFAEFIKEKIESKEGGTVKKKEVFQEFKDWYQNNYGISIRGKSGPAPKSKELYTCIDKRFGKWKPGGWKNIAIIYEEEDYN